MPSRVLSLLQTACRRQASTSCLASLPTPIFCYIQIILVVQCFLCPLCCRRHGDAEPELAVRPLYPAVSNMSLSSLPCCRRHGDAEPELPVGGRQAGAAARPVRGVWRLPRRHHRGAQLHHEGGLLRRCHSCAVRRPSGTFCLTKCSAKVGACWSGNPTPHPQLPTSLSILHSCFAPFPALQGPLPRYS